MSLHKHVFYSAYQQGNHLGDLYHTPQGLTFRVTDPSRLEALCDAHGDLIALEGEGRSHFMGSRHFRHYVQDATIIHAALPE